MLSYTKKAVYAILISVFVILLILCISTKCRHKETFDLLHTEEDILEISLVEISFGRSGEVIQTELQKVEDTDAFISDFRKVDCFIYFGDPTGVVPPYGSSNVIKIVYENGDFDLINYLGQGTYTSGRGYNCYNGFNVFDEEQFFSLIEKYFPDYAESLEETDS